MITTHRPQPSEFPEYYHAYVAAAIGEDIPQALRLAGEHMRATLRDLSPEKGDHRYAPEKWSLKEVVQHMIDAERVFSYRAMRFARNDATELPAFEENDYVPEARTERRTLRDLMEEHDAVRASTIALFRSFDELALRRVGTANRQRVTVNALGWIIAGHAMHHLRVIEERYLP